MRHPAVPLLLAAAICMAACSNDPGNEPQEEQHSNPLSGTYAPSHHVDNISYADGTMELWLWDGELLSALADADMCGGYEEKSWFSYEGSRVAMLQSTLEGMPYQAHFAYLNGLVSTVQVTSAVGDVLQMDFVYGTDKHLQRADLDIPVELLGTIGSALGFIPSIGDASALDIENADINMSLTWAGNNVEQAILNSEVDASLTLGEAKAFIDLDELLGGLASFVDALPDDTPLPIHFTMHDTTSYSFDTHANPFCGFLGGLDVTTLCSNNPLHSEHRTGVVIDISVATPLGDIPFSLPYAMPSRSEQYSYTYDENGMPVEVILNGDTVKTITYQQ